MKRVPLAEIEDGSIEAGLLLLRAWRAERPGWPPLTQREIAFVCGCSRAQIFYHESAALKKIRRFHLAELA